jgi:hypothetical protein
VAGCPRAVAQQLAQAGDDALVGVALDRVLAHAVGGEEQQLFVAALVMAAGVTAVGGGRPGGLGADPRHHETGHDGSGQRTQHELPHHTPVHSPNAPDGARHTCCRRLCVIGT